MTADIENLVLEHLRAICATQAQHSEELATICVEISAMGQQLAGQLDSLKRRVERIERRLDLRDAEH